MYRRRPWPRRDAPDRVQRVGDWWPVRPAGGEFSFAAGVEHRREEGSFTPSEYQRLGQGRSVPIQGAKGDYHTNEIFAEFLAPLFNPDWDLPGLHRLDLTLKGRRVVNSVAGGFNAYTYGIQYEAVRESSCAAARPSRCVPRPLPSSIPRCSRRTTTSRKSARCRPSTAAPIPRFAAATAGPSSRPAGRGPGDLPGVADQHPRLGQRLYRPEEREGQILDSGHRVRTGLGEGPARRRRLV